MTELLGLKKDDDVDSILSHAESEHRYKENFNETKAEKVLKAQKYVSSSSEANQLITLCLCHVLKKNKRL